MTQHVLITGASQGSGRATALLFAQKGWNVTLTARGGDRLETVAQEIQSIGRKALAVPADVGDAEQVASLVEQSLNTFGKIDALINNAGICLTGSVVNTTLDDWRQILDTNLWGCIHTVHAVLPSMLEQGQGTIVNVGSFGGKMPLPQMTAYCTSKYALTGFTESLRLELQAQGIHVGIVHPGIIDSDFMERALFRGASEKEADGLRQQMAENLGANWVSQPKDIAEAVVKMVDKQQAETVVGPLGIATELNRLFPQLTQWALAKGVSS